MCKPLTDKINYLHTQLGESTENYGLDEDNDAIQDESGAEDFNRPFAPEDEETLRAPSPLPPLPAPDPIEFENERSIADQFEYVKHVLAAVLDDTYGPARVRHAGFMRGGGAQRKVLAAVPPRGSLSAADKEEVAFLVRSWAWRRERRLEMGVSVEYPRDELYPPPPPSKPEHEPEPEPEDEGQRRPVGGDAARVVSVLCLLICSRSPWLRSWRVVGPPGPGGEGAHDRIIRT